MAAFVVRFSNLQFFFTSGVDLLKLSTDCHRHCVPSIEISVFTWIITSLSEHILKVNVLSTC